MREAVRQEPDNMQYRMALERMEGGGTWYEQQQNPFGGMPMAGDDFCLKLCIANMVCNMCCGGRMFFC
jgi:molecular chaperone DnaJ